MNKNVVCCDGCGKVIERPISGNYHIYKITLKTDQYVDAAGSPDTSYVHLDFCLNCAKNELLPALKKIAEGEESNE